MEDELKELEETIEREKEDHEALMKQKNQEYEDTEKELTDNNQEICTYALTVSFLLSC